eukprot:3172032-Prymnesium_polylepis.2
MVANLGHPIAKGLGYQRHLDRTRLAQHLLHWLANGLMCISIAVAIDVVEHVCRQSVGELGAQRGVAARNSREVGHAELSVLSVRLTATSKPAAQILGNVQHT